MDFEKFVISIHGCSHVDELYSVFTETVSEAGFDSNVFSLLTPHKSINLDAGHAIASAYPEDWMKHYTERNYLPIDPIIHHAFKTPYTFAWSELKQSDRLTKEQATILCEAEEAGLRSGVGTPLYGINGEIAGFGLSAQDGHAELHPHILAKLHAIGNIFYHSYTRMLNTRASDGRKLTPREVELLQWLAAGKTKGEIADILSISEETVRTLMKRIFQKLEVNSSTLAVVEAIRYGIVHPLRIKL